jgi:putative hydroxymethylpyrimidine transport system substrate-binding protein
MKRNVFYFAIACLLFLSSPAKGSEKLVLMLDWFPNVDHVPIYVAMQSGIFEKHGLTVEIQSPSDSADPLKLAAAGHVDIALSYQPQIIIAASEGIPLKAVGKLVGSPLTTLLFLEKGTISTPADLEGKIIGYTVPGMMDHLTRAFASINAIETYTMVNVGFSILQSLATGKVDAVMGPFKNYEPVLLEMEGYASNYFEIERFGIPSYDELVFVSGRTVHEKKKKAIRKFLAALDEALTYTSENSAEALKMYFHSVPEAPKDMETKAFTKTLPFFAENTRLDRAQWNVFAEFALRYDMIREEVDLNELIDGR